MAEEKKKRGGEETRYLLYVLLSGIVIKTLFYLSSPQVLEYRVPSAGTDMVAYHNWAVTIAGGKLVSDQAFFLAPLYPYLLGLLYAIIGVNLAAVQFLQYGLGVLSGLVLFRLLRRVCETRPAFVITLLFYLYPVFFIFESVQLITTLAIFFNLLACLFLVRYCERFRLGDLVMAGIVCGLSILARGNLLLVMPFWGAVVLLARGREIKPRILHFVIFTAATVLTVSPATIHNYAVEKRFVLVTANAGVNLYIGNNPDAPGWFKYPPKMPDDPGSAALKWIREDPRRFMKHLWKKTRYFLLDYEIPQNVDLVDFFEGSKMIGGLYRGLRFGPLFACGVTGLVLMSFYRRRGVVIILIFVVVYSFSVILFFVTDRYRLPVVPVFFIGVGYLFTCVREYLRARRILELGIVACLIFGGVHLSGQVPKEIDAVIKGSRLRAVFNQANDMITRERYDQAYPLLEDIVRKKPDYANAWRSLGIAAFELKKYDRAIAAFQRELSIRPATAEVYYHLGKCYLFKGDVRSAEEYLKKTLELAPEHPGALWRLGGLEYNKGNLARAKSLCQKSIKYDPQNGKAYATLGIIAFKEGDMESLAEYAEKSRQFDPEGANTKLLLDKVSQLKARGILE